MNRWMNRQMDGYIYIYKQVKMGYRCTLSELIILTYRYSYHHKLIPLLITGINDEVLDIKTIAWQIWEKVSYYNNNYNYNTFVYEIQQVGLKYAEENEQDLKDKMDFAKPQNSFPDSRKLIS